MTCECQRVFGHVFSNVTIGSFNGFSAGTVSWLGHTIMHIGFWNGAGFGALTGIIAWATMHFLSDHCNSDEDWINVPLSYLIGGVTVYAGSSAAAAVFGLTSPISLPSTAILTAASFGSFLLLSQVVKIDCCPDEDSEGQSPTPLMNAAQDNFDV